MPSTEVEAPAASSEELAAINAAQADEFSSDLFTTPILKIGQPLTKEVSDELADPGDFIDTLTGDSLGDSLGFVTAFYQRGRFAVDRDSNRAFVAFGANVPDAWKDLKEVGPEFVGTPFTELPDAEETFKQRVNNGEIEWGSGPPVSTTHNFTGLAIVEPPEGVDEEAELRPVRLSLQRTNVPTVKKWVTLFRSQRNASWWDKVYDLSTYKKDFARGSAYLLNVRLGRETTSGEKSRAVELAQAVIAGRVGDNQAEGAGADQPAAPEAAGAVPL